ncbi:MAG TPA: hypothetical protein VES97_11820 [Solirubrobacteraceae bacterium]|nr:hypothetical protein [Solirubrobacteraceae bacterium]
MTSQSSDVYLIAHIGKIPVEEWLPFLVPVLALYLYGRHWSRRHREALRRLPDAGEPLDDATVSCVLARWSAADHEEVSPGHLPVLYPPGPDGATAAELARRIHSDPAAVKRQLEDLADLGYLDLEDPQGMDEPRAWLTAEGYDLMNVTEDALLAASPGSHESDRS